jgi:hypothetical protein
VEHRFEAFEVEVRMRPFLMSLAVLPFLTGLGSAAQPLSDAQLERITAGASGLPSFATNFPSLPGLLTSGIPASTASSSVSSSPDYEASAFGLGEAGLTGSARLAEYLGVTQFLGHQ